MKLTLEHVALSVADLGRSIAFYCDLLGMEVIRTVDCPADSRLGEVVGLPGCSARFAQLTSGLMVLELFEYVDPRGRKIPPDRTQADNGLTHFGFDSEDIHADYARLRAHGVEFCHEPIEYRSGVWCAYFRGPDGETCELRQLTA